MGVLDDAIREHLELKRQHGASEDEVSKQEQEALGAARGEPVASPQAETAAEPQADEPEPAEAPIDEPELQEPEVEWTDPEPPVDPGPPAELAAGDTPPRGFDRVGDAPLPAEDAGDEDVDDEDVLEETPDFLQETPEHDRLWFEQKPPRDFDFDDE